MLKLKTMSYKVKLIFENPTSIKYQKYESKNRNFIINDFCFLTRKHCGRTFLFSFFMKCKFLLKAPASLRTHMY